LWSCEGLGEELGALRALKVDLEKSISGMVDPRWRAAGAGSLDHCEEPPTLTARSKTSERGGEVRCLERCPVVKNDMTPDPEPVGLADDRGEGEQVRAGAIIAAQAIGGIE
jgi:hypothetical protein